MVIGVIGGGEFNGVCVENRDVDDVFGVYWV